MNSSFDLRSAATTRSSERQAWIGSAPSFSGSAADESGLSSLNSDGLGYWPEKQTQPERFQNARLIFSLRSIRKMLFLSPPYTGSAG